MFGIVIVRRRCRLPGSHDLVAPRCGDAMCDVASDFGPTICDVGFGDAVVQDEVITFDPDRVVH